LKKILIKFSAMPLILAVGIIGTWYSAFILIPKHKVSKLVNEFDVVARSYDKKAIDEMVILLQSFLIEISPCSYNHSFVIPVLAIG
jgi:hypothetical protein